MYTQHYVLMEERRVPFKAKIYWNFHHTLSHVRTILRVIIICVSFFHFYFAVCEWVYAAIVVDYCSCLPSWYRNAKNQFCVRTCLSIVECVEAKNLVMILFSLVHLQQYHLLHAKTYPPSPLFLSLSSKKHKIHISHIWLLLSMTKTYLYGIRKRVRSIKRRSCEYTKNILQRILIANALLC